MKAPALVLLALAVAACAPAHRPVPAAARVETPAAWRDAVAGTAVNPHWWRTFGDPALDALVASALARNADVLLAQARVEEARALMQAAEAARFPTLNAGLGVQAGHTLGATGVTTTRSAQPELQASWEPDLWGRIRTQAQAAALQYRAGQAESDAAALAVAAQTAQAYLALLALDEQLRITQATAVSRTEALRLASDQARVGYISQLQLTQAQAEYETVAQSVPQLELAVRRQENALRVLAGDVPGAVARGLAFNALRLPPAPAMLPSDLLRRRPDIVQRELLLAASDAGLAARRAAFLPQVQLSARFGSLLVNVLDYDPITVWSLGGSVLAPLFSAGRLEAQVDAAAAQRDQAAYAYRRTVLAAFAEVENALAGVGRIEAQMDHAVRRRDALARSLDFAHDRYRAGYASYLEELDAQRNLFRAELDIVSLRQSQLDNLVTLYRALGGGWGA
jgi:multidrug efflux system outer membrane protein